MTSEPKLGSPANIFWIAVTTLLLLFWGFGRQTWAWYEAREMGKSQPCLLLIPRPLADESTDEAPGSRQLFFGYEFEVPWSNPEVKAFHHLASFSQDGYGLIFWNPADRHNLISEAIKSGKHPNMQDALAVSVGNEAARSDYDFLSHTLNVTPQKITPTESSREANWRLTLLRIKSVNCLAKVSAFFSFQSKSLRCIQIGEPSLDRVIEVRCFDAADQEFNFHFSAKQDSGAPLTQRQINRVILTLHPTNSPPLEPTEAATRR